VALGLAHERFAMRSEPLLDRFAEQNKRTVIILQVEDPRGAESADEIAALPGVDALWLGHNDLSVAMNKPGAFTDPQFLKHEQATIAAARKHGKSAGRLSVDARQAAEFVKLGYDFVAIAGDVWLLQQAFASGVAAVRAAKG
jgi:2-dehydro-3-deoxyglucarate aldolase/4-hydroxy-2-oxoheptanedioate aldolase